MDFRNTLGATHRSMVSELRDRRISGTRAEILAALEPLRIAGAVTPAEWDRFVSQLGLV